MASLIFNTGSQQIQGSQADDFYGKVSGDTLWQVPGAKGTSGQFEFPHGFSGTLRPAIRFNIKKAHKPYTVNQGVILPAPPAIAVSDNASYSDAELGIAGGVVREMLGKSGDGSLEKGITEGFNEALKSSSGSESVVRGAIKAASAKLTSAGSGAIPGGEGMVKAYQMSANGGILNKNITTEFTGVQVRTYGFAWKLVAFSEQESKTISDIVNFFRICLYPELEDYRLRYPPLFRITIDGAINMPKFFPECYLQQFSSTYNSESNTYYADGSPTEVDIQCAFVESRAMVRKDVADLT